MQVIQFLFNIAINFFVVALLVSVILSWLITFNVVNPRNEIVGTILRLCHFVTEPVLGRIRRYVPSVGNLDLSVLVAFIGARALQIGVNAYVINPAVRAGF